MIRPVAALALLVTSASSLPAQDEARLRQKLEGKRMVVQLDMPATSEGVDVIPGSSRPIDFGKYSNRVKANGVAIRGGEGGIITKVKVKDDLIEIHLGGGGYGTMGDALSSMFSNKGADSGVAQQARIANERSQRASAGSRFNLRYPNGVTPDDLTPQAVVAALQEYASIPALTTSIAAAPVPVEAPAAAQSAPAPLAQSSTSPAPATGGMPKKGMSPDEVEKLAGKPSSSKANGPVTTSSYAWPDGVLEADFFNGVLVAYRIKSS